MTTCTLCGQPIAQAKAPNGTILPFDPMPVKLYVVETTDPELGLGVSTMGVITGFALGYPLHRVTCRGLMPPPPWAEHFARFGLELAAVGALALYVEHSDRHYTQTGLRVDAWHKPPGAAFPSLGGALCAT